MNLAVLIPSYNTGADLLLRTVRGALEAWPEVWVVIDGSTDGSDRGLEAELTEHAGLRVLRGAKNAGKGAAVLLGAKAARAAGFTHVLTMDADGQHPPGHIRKFTSLAAKVPQAVLLGVPQFGAEAPAIRIYGRRISNGWAYLETLGWGIGDSLFGMRVYPLDALIEAFHSTFFARRFDFDTEIAVRIAWKGVPMIQVPTPVRYLTAAEGGVSQFRYGRDNALLSWMHARLLLGFLLRLPLLMLRQLRGGNPLRHHPV